MKRYLLLALEATDARAAQDKIYQWEGVAPPKAGDAEFADQKTGLIWRRCAEGMAYSGGTCTGTAREFTYEAALQHAASQARSTGIAWRLPNIQELSSIVDRKFSPSIDPTVFPATPSGSFFSPSWFWSASPVVGDSFAANGIWAADFTHDGGASFSNRFTGSNYVRLVRSGQ
jgi:hypothetical protein